MLRFLWSKQAEHELHQIWLSPAAVVFLDKEMLMRCRCIYVVTRILTPFPPSLVPPPFVDSSSHVAGTASRFFVLLKTRCRFLHTRNRDAASLPDTPISRPGGALISPNDFPNLGLRASLDIFFFLPGTCNGRDPSRVGACRSKREISFSSLPTSSW